MKLERLIHAAALTIGLLAAPILHAADPEPEPSRLRVGMSQNDVRTAFGKPRTIARQILIGEFVEIWTFEDAVVEFRCLKGQKPFVVNVHQGDSPKR